jgi:hypothetical protein
MIKRKHRKGRYRIKRILLFLTGILMIGAFSGCGKEIESGAIKDTLFEFPRENIQSIIVSTYDLEHEQTTSNMAFTQKDMEELLDYLEDLSGNKTDSINIQNLNGPFYGIELNADRSYKILFAGDYAINEKGEYFLIDSSEAVRMCESVVNRTTVSDQVSYIVNHRYISLIDGKWNTKYMPESIWTEAALKKASLTGTVDSVASDCEKLELTITNQTGYTLEFGSKLTLEVRVGEVWYNIDNMFRGGADFAWTDELCMLDSGKTYKDTYYNLNYYLPLPAGSYRLIKEVSVNDETGYLAYEFTIE